MEHEKSSKKPIRVGMGFSLEYNLLIYISIIKAFRIRCIMLILGKVKINLKNLISLMSLIIHICNVTRVRNK